MPEKTGNARIAALRRKLKERDLDALLVHDPVNVRYLCGFGGTYGLLVVDRRGAHFFTDGRYAEIAASVVSGAKIHVQPLAEIDGWFADFFRDRGYGTLGFDGSLTVDALDSLKKRLRTAKTKTAKASGLVEEIRIRKDESEIRAIAKAARAADRMMQAAFDALKPGVRELDVARVVRRAAEDLGASGESFESIVASGPNSSRPHHRPSARRVGSGDMVTVDLGCVVGGYCSDLTRNPVLGKVSRRFEEIYAVCLEAQQAAVKACRSGAKCSDVDGVAREIIATAGYGEYFMHGLGHGVGLEIHEAPRLNRTSGATLQPGMVVTVEPGIYVPGFGGVRIEDLLVVAEGAPRVLSKSPKALTVLPA